MADIFTKEKRSEIMSCIRGKETALEKKVFKYLRREGIYFQKHYARAPGKPDIALPRKKKAVFIDGDFWHGWKFKERKHKLPKEYWREKIRKNIARDRKNRKALRDAGWQVLRVWEHELNAKKREQKGLDKIRVFLLDDLPPVEKKSSKS